jgi:hypothetical protein
MKATWIIGNKKKMLGLSAIGSLIGQTSTDPFSSPK